MLPNVSETVNATICAGETFAGYTMTGSYTDHFTSSNGCDSTRVLNLTVRELPNVSVQVTQPTCELSLGSITILGDPIFFYDWDNGADGQVQDSLPAGTYNVSVTDLHGCMVELVPIVLNEPIGSDTTWVNLQSCDSDELGVFIETFGTNGCDSVVVRTVTRGLDCTPRRICNIVVTTNGQSVFVNIKDDIAEGLQIERWDYSIIPNSQVTTARHAATGHWTVKGHHEVQIPMNLRLADANDYFVVCIIATTEEINGKREEFYVVPPNSPDEVIKMGVKVF